MSVTTKMVWSNESYLTNQTYRTARAAYIETAMAAGKTDGTHVENGNLETRRTWVDQAAADEWTTFITNLAEQNGLSVTVTVI